MSTFPGQSESAAEARDLEIREYMEQMDIQKHEIFSHKPLFDDKTGHWLDPPDDML